MCRFYLGFIKIVARLYIRTYALGVSGTEDDDEDFLALLNAYLDEPHEPNLQLTNVQIVWVEDDPRLGARHIAAHDVSKEEVEQVLLEIPPVVESKRSREHPDRTLFRGATRRDRWVFIACEDWTEVRFAI